MIQPRMTFSEFLVEQRGSSAADPLMTLLLDDIQAACKQIDTAVAVGALGAPGGADRTNIHGEPQNPLDLVANDVMLRQCECGGQLCGMISEEMAAPYRIPEHHSRGPYLLAFDPLEGSSNVDLNVTVGTVFAVLRAPDGITDAREEDFLQPGVRQIVAGFALYGPALMLVLTLGSGVHGFTLDTTSDTYTLTHPHMRIPEESRELAINASNARFWEPPVRHYVEECFEGKDGPRGADFDMRWSASLVADVHHVLIRGGVCMYPREVNPPLGNGRLRLLYAANPMAMLVEQAGGAAWTGRERILDVTPSSIHQRVPVILGSRSEVDRLTRYHATFDHGEQLAFATPLFRPRSVLRSA